MRIRFLILLPVLGFFMLPAHARAQSAKTEDLQSFGCFIVIDAEGTKNNIGCVKDLDTENQSDIIDQLEDVCENPSDIAWISKDCGKEKTDPAGKKYTATCTWEEVDNCAAFEGDTTGQTSPPKFAPPPPFEPKEAADLGGLITDIYNWSLGILGLGVFSMITYGGALWLTAAGNPGKIANAKSKISNALLGAVLLLSSYLILNLINPDLLKQSTKLQPLRRTPPGGGSGAGGAGGAAQPPPPSEGFQGGGGEFGGGGASGTF